MVSRDFHPKFSYSENPVYHAGMPLHSIYKKYAILGYPIMDVSCSADLNLSDMSLHPSYCLCHYSTPKGTPTTCHLGTENFVTITPANAPPPEQCRFSCLSYSLNRNNGVFPKLSSDLVIVS